MAPRSRQETPQLVSYSPGPRGPILTATIPRRPGWQVEAEFDGSLIRSIRVFPHEVNAATPDGGVTALLLRDIPMSLLPFVLSNNTQRSDADGPATIADLVDGWHGPGTLEAMAKPPHPGRRGRGDRFYAEWAARYVDAVRRSTAPVRDLAEEHNYSPATIRDIVAKARAKGLLTPAPPRKAGGQLTTKARQLLETNPTDGGDR